MKGWISLHRQIMDHWLYKEKRVFSRYEAWLDIVMLASHDDTTFVHGNEVVAVERGEFITSELKLMERWGWSKSKVRSFLDVLQKDRMLDRKTDSKKTALKVHNYAVYQHFTNHEKTAEDTTVDNAVDTQSINKQINKLTKKPSSRKKRVFNEDDIEFKIASHLLERIMSMNPNVKQPDLQKWSDHVRLMIQEDKRPVEEIRELFKWMYTVDTFWRDKILSTKNLRDKYDAMNTKRLSNTSIPKNKGFIPERPINRRDEERDTEEDEELMKEIRKADAKRIAALGDVTTT